MTSLLFVRCLTWDLNLTANEEMFSLTIMFLDILVTETYESPLKTNKEVVKQITWGFVKTKLTSLSMIRDKNNFCEIQNFILYTA